MHNVQQVIDAQQNDVAPLDLKNNGDLTERVTYLKRRGKEDKFPLINERNDP